MEGDIFFCGGFVGGMSLRGFEGLLRRTWRGVEMEGSGVCSCMSIFSQLLKSPVEFQTSYQIIGSFMRYRVFLFIQPKSKPAQNHRCFPKNPPSFSFFPVFSGFSQAHNLFAPSSPGPPVASWEEEVLRREASLRQATRKGDEDLGSWQPGRDGFGEKTYRVIFMDFPKRR